MTVPAPAAAAFLLILLAACYFGFRTHAGVRRTQASALLNKDQLIDRLRGETAGKEHQSLHDSLTGLPNRVRFHEVVTGGLQEQPPLAAMMLMDIDRFTDVNVILGDETGDRLLVEVSGRLCDILGKDHTTVARLGDDEFAIFLNEVVDVADAETIARLILLALERPFVLGDVPLEIGASIGMALYPAHGCGSAALLQRANAAMQHAKTLYLGYAVYAVERDRTNPHRLTLAAELRSAIENGELSVSYQPKADLTAGRIGGVEALVRWTHPRHGSLAPDEFIPVAEQTGLIRPLTDLVLDRSLRQCRSWSALGHDLSVAVNLSARSLLDNDLTGTIGRALESTGIPPSLLTLEITESMIMADPVRALDTMHRLATMGISLSIDDFGTGYSALSYLGRLPVHEVKIDKSFVLNMTRDDNDAAIVRAIIGLAMHLRLRVVAEGVEDASTLAALGKVGCDTVQGYYLSRPVPAASLTARLAASGTSLSRWMPSCDEVTFPVAQPRTPSP